MSGQLAVFSGEQFTVMMQEIGVTQVEEFMMIFTLKLPTALLKKLHRLTLFKYTVWITVFF